jgi:hypothetical protein
MVEPLWLRELEMKTKNAPLARLADGALRVWNGSKRLTTDRESLRFTWEAIAICRGFRLFGLKQWPIGLLDGVVNQELGNDLARPFGIT